MDQDQQSTSDWETFFKRCATDEDYRRQLSEALREKNVKVAVKLLAQIGVSGDDPEQRVEALTSAREPMLEVARAFGAPHDFVAP